MRIPIFIAAIAPACIVLSAPAAARDAATPQAFLTEAMKGNNTEVAMGRLASEHGASKAIRDYGATLQQDHGKAQENAARIARSLNIPVTTALLPDAPAVTAQLRKLQGPAFDSAFAHHMAEDHQKDIAKYEKAAKMSGAVGSYAQQTLPDLRKHLGIAQKLSGSAR